MPVLDAKALDIDPTGMAFLRAVVRPDFEHEEAATRPFPGKRFKPPSTDSEAQTNSAVTPTPSKMVRAVARVG